MTERQFDESKVKRDKIGRFAENSSKQLEDSLKQELKDKPKYEEVSISLGDSKEGDELYNSVKNYKPNGLKSKVYARTGEQNKHYSKAVDSAVMSKYSTVRKKVDKYGFAIIKANDGKFQYWIKINKSDDDFDYDIIRKKKI